MTSTSSEGFTHARDEADAAWKKLMEERYLAISLLKDALFDPGEGPVRFVSVLEAIGVNRASEILEILPRAELDEVKKRDPQVLPPEQGFRIVGEFSRRAQTERALRPAYFNELNLEGCLRATDTELALALDALPQDDAALALLFVTPERALRVVGKLTREDKEEVLGAVPAMARTTQSEAVRVSEKLTGSLGQARAVEGYDATGLLSSLLEKADASLRGVVQKILDSDEQLRTEVKARVVVFDDCLRLERDVIVELLEGLEIEDLAALFMTTNENVSQGLLGLLPPKRAYAVREEMKRNGSRPLLFRKAQSWGMRMQAEIVARARAMVSEGELPPPEQWGQDPTGQNGNAQGTRQTNGTQANGSRRAG